MTNLYNYIYESTFASGDFYKHNYAKDVVAKIVAGENVRIGAKGENSFTVPNDILAKVQDEFDEIKSTNLSKEMFDEIMSSHHLPTWTKIFKGDFSGYKEGLASKNKGNEFEQTYVENWDENQVELAKFLGISPEQFEGTVPELLGEQNQPRPLVPGKEGVVLGGSHATVGESVVDVLVKDINGNPYNLSLKYGSSVTFCNAGVSRIFSKRSFDEYEQKKIYTPETANGVNGQDLLDLFNIDKEKFAEVFVGYGKKHGKDYVDITKELKHSKAFEEFIESVVGYNYILVHKIGNKIHYVDLRTEQNMRKLIGQVKSAEIQYGGASGDGKRIDILVELTNMRIKFNIRNKQGGVYPTHIMSDYIIRH